MTLSAVEWCERRAREVPKDPRQLAYELQRMKWREANDLPMNMGKGIRK